MSELVDHETFTLTFAELLKHCKTVKFEVTTKQVEAVEKVTRQQSASQSWFRFKAGRISGSTTKSCCHANLDLPSQSLIKSICYPTNHKFSSAATKWGCDHEKIAIEHYKKEKAKEHSNFKVKDSGFIISTEYPDGLVSCDCCDETGDLEIKCPFCIKDKMIEEGCKNKGFCLVSDSNGKPTLYKNHAYYYQVQNEVNICSEASYVDFALCHVE